MAWRHLGERAMGKAFEEFVKDFRAARKSKDGF
jgi:hypothetical protein